MHVQLRDQFTFQFFTLNKRHNYLHKGRVRDYTTNPSVRVSKRSSSNRNASLQRTAMITYALGRGLYVALTNRCNATPLFHTRGPGFKITSTKFEPLPAGAEPEPREVIEAVDTALDASGNYNSIVFAGLGEPTLRLEALLEISQVKTFNAGVMACMNTILSTNNSECVGGRNSSPAWLRTSPCVSAQMDYATCFMAEISRPSWRHRAFRVSLWH